MRKKERKMLAWAIPIPVPTQTIHRSHDLSQTRAQRLPRRRPLLSWRSRSSEPTMTATNTASSTATPHVDLRTATVNQNLLSPMMRHYVQTKLEEPSHLLLYRVGDFYEAFFEDAATLSDICDISLTSKDGGRLLAARVPMSGVPHHALESKLRLLLAAGASVAVADQVGAVIPGNALVERRITRILTPGTLADCALLSPRTATFLAAIHAPSSTAPISVAIADVSTGDFRAGSLQHLSALSDFLARERPAEIVAAAAESVLAVIRESSSVPLRIRDINPHTDNATILLRNYVAAVDPAARLEAVRPLGGAADASTLELDAACVRNMEIVMSMRGGEPARSLRAAVDRSITPMGARTVRASLLSPLRDAAAIRARHAVVHALLVNAPIRTQLRDSLRPVADIERLAGRVAAERASPRNVRALAVSITALPAIASLAKSAFDAADDDTRKKLPKDLISDLIPPDDALEAAREAVLAIVDPAPATLVPEAALTGPVSALGGVEWAGGRGAIFTSGYDKELDELRARAEHPDSWTVDFEAVEQERTGIPQLRIRHVKRMGYVLRVPRTAAMRALDADPSAFSKLGYERVQSTKAEVRFRSARLAELERAHHAALAGVLRRELGLFCELRSRLGAHVGAARASARALALLDVLAGFAEVAAEQGYVQPEMLPGSARRLEITDCRHPVVEQVLPVGSTYVANSFALGGGEAPDEVILCGPNAAGKSCAIRSVGLCVILAQAGSFVPARAARISVCDRVLTRVGAVDDVADAMSSFQVEMAETAAILSAASGESLVLLDEIGRGTSVVDGIGIACAVAEALAQGSAPPRTLFVTHYHELNVLASVHRNIATMAMQVVDGGGGRPVATHRLVHGAAWASLGVEVARKAGFPDEVVRRAEVVAGSLRVPARALGTALRQEFEEGALEGESEGIENNEQAYRNGFRDGREAMRKQVQAALGGESFLQ